ncbi:MAG: SH3 domain-containing protein, partial [Lachnospiraceae bacterium]|nr:SH3 domain-containing protein [Lachnospiraceae bacterium]
ILLVMSAQYGFTSEEISGIFGLAPEKIDGELGKLDSLLPALAKKQQESNAVWLASWEILLSGAFSEVLAASETDWVDDLFARAAKAAGVDASSKDDFEYFVADVDLSEEKPLRGVVPTSEPEESDEEEDDEDYDDEDDDDDDEDYDDEDDDDDDRYDWDLEDDNRKMIVLGVVLALVLVAVIAFGVHIFTSRNSGSSSNTQTEESADTDAELVIKGDDEDADAGEETEVVEEVAEETEETEETEEEEVTTVTMQANTSSLNVRSEGSTDGDVLTQLSEGEQVEVLSDTSEEWVQIRCIEQDDLEGYVMLQYLSEIEE